MRHVVLDGFRTRNLLSQSQGKTFELSERYSLRGFLLRNPSRAGDRDKLSCTCANVWSRVEHRQPIY